MSKIESNKLIAEFMGATVTEPYPEHKEYGKSYHFEFNNSEQGKKCWPDNERTYTNSSIKYHTSWDWLMPVVEKVEGMGHEILISKNGCMITHVESDGIMSFGTEGTKIENVYSAVIQFITWYNNLHKNA